MDAEILKRNLDGIRRRIAAAAARADRDPADVTLIAVAAFILPPDRVAWSLVGALVLNLVIGLVTPPVGICLFIAAGVGRVPIEHVIRECLPFLAWLIVVLLILALLWFAGRIWLQT